MKLDKVEVDVHNKEVDTVVPAGKPHRWGEFRPIYDYENSGYTQ